MIQIIMIQIIMIQMMIRLKNFGFTEEEAFKYGKFFTPVYITLPE